MNIVILNIGLPRNTPRPFIGWGDAVDSATRALKAIRKAGMPIMEHYAYLTQFEEPVLVVETSAPDNVIHALSAALGEDCIAVWDRLHREGRLVGPKAAEWGAFDPSKFVLLNGSLLSEARSV